MKLTPIPAAALFALACTGAGDDKGGHSGSTDSDTEVVPPMPPPPEHSSVVIGLPPLHSGHTHTGLLGPAHTGGSGASTTSAPVTPPPMGLSPRPSVPATGAE